MSHVFQWTWNFPEFHLDLRPCVQVELCIERLSFLFCCDRREVMWDYLHLRT
jgi:hypothetical protein